MTTATKGEQGVAAIFPARTLLWILAGIVAVRFISLGLYPLIDKTEARYAHIGELMVLSGNWITPQIDPGVPFWAKPVLSTWLTAVSLVVFGVNAFAARFSSFLIFITCGWLVFALATQQRGRTFGLVAACIFASSGLMFYLGGTVMTDPALLLGVTLTMAGYWQCVAEPRDHARLWGYLFFFGVAIGLLSKGPIGAIIPGISIVIWATHQRRWMDSWSRLPWVGGIVLVLVLVVPWYVAAEMRTPGFLRYFIIGEHFERFLVPNWNGDLYGSSRTLPFGTIFLFVFVGALPWSGILIGLLFRKTAREDLFSRKLTNDPWLSYLIYWTLAPLLLFTFARNILMTYAATSVPALALLTAHALWQRGRRLDRGAFVTAALAIPVLIIGVVAVSLMKPGIRELPTQANIVATVKKMDGAGKLVYVFDRPYSASFYSRGTALLAHNNAQAEELYKAGAKYFAVAQRAYDRLAPDLQNRLERIAVENNTLLLRRR
jgi:4-amino-4-deoxy-L-arabinose transferase-like glycosyltransferase